MRKELKILFKSLLCAVLCVFLVVFSGLMRLATHPVRLSDSPWVSKHFSKDFTFEEIYLGTGPGFMPEMRIKALRVSQPGLSLEAPIAHASWSLSALVQGHLGPSSIRLLDPKIRLNSVSSGDESFLDSLKEGLAGLPCKSIEIQRAHISFVDKAGRAWETKDASLYILRLSRLINLSGRGVFLGVPHPFSFRIDGSISRYKSVFEGVLKVKGLVPADLANKPFVESSEAQEFLRRYDRPLDAETDVRLLSSPANKLSIRWSTLLTLPPEPSLGGLKPIHCQGDWQEGQELSLEMATKSLSAEGLKWLYPEISPKELIAKHLTAIEMSDVKLQLLYRQRKDGLALKKFACRFAFDKGAVRFFEAAEGLPLFTDLSGKASIDPNAFRLELSGGKFGGISFKNTHVEVSKFGDPSKAAQIAGSFNLEAAFKELSITDQVCRSLSMPELPFTFLPTGGALRAHGRFLRAPGSGFTYQVRGDLSQGVFTVSSKPKDGKANDGKNSLKAAFRDSNLTYDVSDQSVNVEGTTLCNGAGVSFKRKGQKAASGEWSLETHLTGAATLSALRSLFPESALFKFLLSKGGAFAFDVTEREKAARLEIEAQLDLKKIALNIPAIRWEKAQNSPGSLSMEAVLDNGGLTSLKAFRLKAKNLAITGHASFDPSTHKLSRIVLRPFRINGASGRGEAVLRNNGWDISASAPYLDLPPLLGMFSGNETGPDKSTAPLGKEGKMGPEYRLHLEVPVLLMKNHQSFQNCVTDFRLHQGQLHFMTIKARDQNQEVRVSYAPEGDNMVLHVFLPRLETLLEGLGVTDSLQATNLQVHAQKPLQDLKTSLKGKLSVETLRVKDAPAFARLLSLISIEGLLSALQGSGLKFNDNYAKFEYLDGRVALRRARVMNSSIGITAVGIVDFKAKTMDLQGVLIPANFINQLVGRVPLLGRLLTGGKDKGLFSVSYSARGALKEPKISSNPLGLLAPNILKNIFDSLTHDKPEKPTFRSQGSGKN